MSARDDRTAAEAAVLEALQRLTNVNYAEETVREGAPAVVLYGWQPESGRWSVKECELAARRLEYRGELEGIAGGGSGRGAIPRRWRIPRAEGG